MDPVSLEQLTRAVRDAWSVETCDDHDVAMWSPANPSRGQCTSTAWVVHDLLGGELLEAEVLRPDGSRQGFHYWNRLPDGTEVDLTREQFGPGEEVGPGVVVARTPLPLPGGAQYERLRDRVRAALSR